MNEFLLLILAYLIGSIPTAVWVSQRYFGFDIREYGSGNAGATNSYRVLGSKWGTTILLLDMLKGMAAVQLAFLLPEYLDSEWRMDNLQTCLGWPRFWVIFFRFGPSSGAVRGWPLYLEWFWEYHPGRLFLAWGYSCWFCI